VIPLIVCRSTQIAMTLAVTLHSDFVVFCWTAPDSRKIASIERDFNKENKLFEPLDIFKKELLLRVSLEHQKFDEVDKGRFAKVVRVLLLILWVVDFPIDDV
jgi:hypothetical protein